MKKVKRFGVSLEEDLLALLDSLAKNQKFPNRSQAIRYLIHEYAGQQACRDNREVSGAIVLIYDHHKRDVVNKSLDIQHDFGGLILASQHVHLDHDNCLEIIAVKGKAKDLNEFSSKLIALKGIRQGKLVLAGE